MYLVCGIIVLQQTNVSTQQEIQLKSLKYTSFYAFFVYIGSFFIHTTHCHKRHLLNAEYKQKVCITSYNYEYFRFI